MELVYIVDSLTKLLFLILLLIQVGIVFFLPPHKAKKFNFLGRWLETLANTKSGFSLKNGSNN